MANPTSSQASSRGTVNTSTTPVSRLNARPHTVFRYRGMKRESVERLDIMAASLRRGMQFSIATMSNSQLVDEAKLLNTRLFESKEEIGPQEKEAIAETLLLMRQKLVYRIQRAAEQQKTTQPVLEHIKWEGKGGQVDNIYPFFMVDHWLTYVKTKPLPKFFLPKPAEIARWSNTKLIAEAERLNNIFLKYLKAKEKTKKEMEPIADTLIVMHGDMTRRLEAATRKQMKFPPVLEGVSWLSENLAGITQGVSPFSMIDIWSLYKSQKQRPKRLVKRYAFEDEVIEGDVPPKPKKCVVPGRITAKKAADRARKAMNSPTRPANFKGELWYYCILWRMEQPAADMWYIDQNGITAIRTREISRLRYYQRAVVNDATVKITRVGSYRLSSALRKKLNRIDREWAKKIVHYRDRWMTKNDRDLLILKLARALTNPEIKKYWLRFHKNARNEIIKLLKESWCNDAYILTKLANFRQIIDQTYSTFHRMLSASGRDPSYAEKLIIARWNKAMNDNNSFLNCKRRYGKQITFKRRTKGHSNGE